MSCYLLTSQLLDTTRSRFPA